MVFLSKAQQKNKNIETLIDNLWDLNKQGIEFKLELKLEYGTLVLDNAKMNCMREKMGLAAAVFGKYIEIEKLPNPLSKLTQIQAYNWLQTQVRLDQKVAMGSILKDRVAFGEEESRPSFWNDEVLPWTSVKKTFKNLHVEHPGLINKVYTREKAPQQKKCRHCGKLLASKAGCKNHERICKKKELNESESKSCCKFCKKSYKVMHYLREHEEKCAKKKSSSGVGMKSLEAQVRKSLLATEKSSDESYETTDSDESEILATLAKENTSDEYSDTGSNETTDSEESEKERKRSGRGRGARRTGNGRAQVPQSQKL